MVINEPPASTVNLVAWLREQREVERWTNAGLRLACSVERRRREWWSWAAIIGWTAFALHVWWRW
jgi:hypothetical protein